MAKDNYFLVNRSLLNHWLWIETPFSRGQAWIDLIGLANHSDKKTMHRGKLIECKRGDVNLSIDHLATRWGWSRGKTKRFLETLEDEQMIVLKTDSRKTVITVENYNIYQHVSEKTDSKRTADGKADGQQTDRQTVRQKDTTKESKRKLKNVKEYIMPAMGEFKNVHLTEEELEKLKEQFPYDWQERIERLSQYMASKGKRYKSHYATILTWARKEEKPQQEKAGRLDWIDDI